MNEHVSLKDFELKCRRAKDVQDKLKLQFTTLKEQQEKFGDDYRPIRKWYSFLSYYLFSYCPVCGQKLEHNVTEVHYNHDRRHTWKDVIYFCTKCGYNYSDTHG